MTAPTALKPRKKPRQARSRATVEAIVEAASQVLVERGYAGMTTTRVAARAGVSVGSLYQYFPSKDALLNALVEERFALVTTLLRDAMVASRGDDLRGRVRAMLGALIAGKAENAALGAALVEQIPRVEGLDYKDASNAAATTLVRSLFEEHREEVSVPDVELAVFLTVNAVEGIMERSVRGTEIRLDDPRLVDGITELVLGFVTSR